MHGGIIFNNLAANLLSALKCVETFKAIEWLNFGSIRYSVSAW